ncbi:hybrid sensor histidine kinase/response regulator [Candidatus Albibeggiatoa sp. nov. NOAA]|uniref:hybrid sensor histidine kinase/response regulator n=1 Tax=Candidatus Albibeggiatoa sp. nov. NOAA TaxID=3162724 RepID=UPI0032FE5567|nr:hybrid sensor histidine kinase/response regulator [Thiotrichaceae bacterium]
MMAQRSKIAIVDDERSMRVQLESLLAGNEYELALFESGMALLAKLSELDPDLIILDLMMPEIDGFEVCRQVKAQPQFQHIPIILVTVLDASKALVEGLEAGADDFIQKPVSRLELRARVRSMLRIKKQYDELEAMLKMREELSNMIVHDMSSSIVSVQLNATLMQEKQVDEEQKERIDSILMAADRLDEFVNDMLMLAKMEQSKLRIHPTMTHIQQLILDAEKHFKIIAQSRGIELKLELPKMQLKMELDANLFRRVLANLLSNALQYSPEGTTVTVKLEILPPDQKGHHLRLQVIDEGPGIPEAYRKRIFEKFEVVELKKKGVAQIGLGLTFCKLAVDAHCGKIYVAPNRPNGSMFIVEI